MLQRGEGRHFNHMMMMMMNLIVTDVDTCWDTFVQFTDLAATSAGQIQPEPDVLTVDDCRERCLNDTECVGFNWMRDGRNASQKCMLYSLVVGHTTYVALTDLYVREICQPNMFISFAPGTGSLYTLVLPSGHAGVLVN